MMGRKFSLCLALVSSFHLVLGDIWIMFDQTQDYENCHETRSSCAYDTISNGYRQRSCWLRCVCSGFSTGVCQKSSRCLESGKPWECQCGPKMKIDIMHSLCDTENQWIY